MANSSSESKVRVRFLTEFDAFRITDSPFVLPQKLGRYGLSEVINHLLTGENAVSAQNQPFDFSINGVLLRTQLKTFLSSNRINLEDVLTIQYMPALSLSEEKETMEAPAWIGCISTAVDGLIIAGCYDGTIQLAPKSSFLAPSSSSSANKNFTNITAHEDPIRAITAWQSASSGKSFFVTASKDMSLRCWEVCSSVPTGTASRNNKTKASNKNNTPADTVSQIAEMKGHINSVESVEYWEAHGLVLSGDWAGNMCGWNLGKATSSSIDDDSGSSAAPKKKIKTSSASSSASLHDIKAVFSIRAHSQSLSSITMGVGSSVVTSSWDHSIKLWDMDTQDCVSTFVSNKVVTSLSLHAGNHAAVTAHPDGKVRLWDFRSGSASNEGSCRNVYTCNDSQWISQVCWHPTIDTVFASSDYGGVVRTWDTRAGSPLGSVEAHDGKALCVSWLSGDFSSDEGAGSVSAKVLSGGSDCALHAHSFG